MNFTKPTNCTWYLYHKFIQDWNLGHNLSDFFFLKGKDDILFKACDWLHNTIEYSNLARVYKLFNIQLNI